LLFLWLFKDYSKRKENVQLSKEEVFQRAGFSLHSEVFEKVADYAKNNVIEAPKKADNAV